MTESDGWTVTANPANVLQPSPDSDISAANASLASADAIHDGAAPGLHKRNGPKLPNRLLPTSGLPGADLQRSAAGIYHGQCWASGKRFLFSHRSAPFKKSHSFARLLFSTREPASTGKAQSTFHHHPPGTCRTQLNWQPCKAKQWVDLHLNSLRLWADDDAMCLHSLGHHREEEKQFLFGRKRGWLHFLVAPEQRKWRFKLKSLQPQTKQNIQYNNILDIISSFFPRRCDFLSELFTMSSHTSKNFIIANKVYLIKK